MHIYFSNKIIPNYTQKKQEEKKKKNHKLYIWLLSLYYRTINICCTYHMHNLRKLCMEWEAIFYFIFKYGRW